jgi:hypothetical protein
MHSERAVRPKHLAGGVRSAQTLDVIATRSSLSLLTAALVAAWMVVCCAYFVS